MGIISKDIGLDLGTSNVRFFVKGKGVVLTEPTVVAINNITDEVLAVGGQAKEMLGRTPENIVAVKPLKDGVIANFVATSMLIKNFLSLIVPKSFFSRPRLVISIPSEITDVEERAVDGVAYKAGVKEVYLIEEVMAAAIGAGLNVDRAEGAMIVDLGGGTCEMAVLSLGGIVVSKSTKIAGNQLDRDIVEYIKKEFNVIVGESEAEEVKKQIAAATATMTEEKVSIKGRNLSTGLPETITVTTSDINKAIIGSLEEIVNVLKMALELTPPELAADIMAKGIVLCGGLSQIKNIDRYISECVGMPVFIAESPTECVIRGIGMSLDNIDILRRNTRSRN